MATAPAVVEEAPPETGGVNDNLEQQTERDYEAEARAQGWVPADEFKGDKSRCVDAETFVKRADEVMPLLRKQLSHYRAELDQMKREIKKVRKSEQASYENAYADLKSQMEKAVETGNVAQFKALDAKADELRKGMAEDTPVADQQKEAARAFSAWRDDNEWYDLGGLPSATETERKQRVYFDRMVEANEDKARTMAPAEFISFIGDLVEAKYPPQRTARPRGTESVAGVTRTAQSKSAKTGVNLPADAKAAAERYMRQGIYKVETKEQAWNLFAKDYDWSEA